MYYRQIDIRITRETPDPHKEDILTLRELEVLALSSVLTNKEIGTRLGISEQTIKNHLTSIMAKMDADSRTEAVLVGIASGLLRVNVEVIADPDRPTKMSLLPKKKRKRSRQITIERPEPPAV